MDDVAKEEWEGFEHFPDVSDPTPNELPGLPRPKPPIPPRTPHQPHPLPKNTPKHHSPARRKDSRPEQPAPEPTAVERFVSKTPAPLASTKTIEDKGSERKPQLRRYERIPINRYEQDCRYAGRVVYKGFIPRTSDHYLRLLKEVEWGGGGERRGRGRGGVEFNSQFEGGNLNLALEVRVGENEYDLYLRVDSNTSGHRQWFYFSMRNERKGKVRLHLYRFKKVYSLYQRGMKPYVRRRTANEWAPGGEAVVYHYERSRCEAAKGRSCVLTFTYNFEYDNDEVYVAAGIPYTYTFLQRQLAHYQQMFAQRELLSCELTELGRSSCGLDLPLLTVEHNMAKLVHAAAPKRYIIVNARTHSGESSSSWVMDGLLQGLASGEVEEWLLRENVCFKIVPMLNPDGVFIGNYRTGIVGDDFNRKFSSGRKEYYPEVHALRKLVGRCVREGKVELFLDLHGHSILKNSFLYGPEETLSSGFPMKNLPYYLFHSSKYFRLASCKFQSEKDNSETARLYFQQKENILTYTCENSLGLYYHQWQTLQMQAEDWQAFGRTVLVAMKDCFSSSEVPIPHAPDSKKRNKPKQEGRKKEEKPQLKLPAYVQPLLRDQECFSPQLPPKNSVSFSQQIDRQDDSLPLKQHSYHDRTQPPIDRPAFKIRRKSEVMKIPSSSIVHRALTKARRQDPKINSSLSEQREQFCFGRAATYDNSQTLQSEIDKMQQQEASSQLYPQFEMEPISENFSDDYQSINDSDSADEDLPDAQRNNVFQYIRANQLPPPLTSDPHDEQPTVERERTRRRTLKEPKISRFREIRFKSIEELYQNEQRDAGRGIPKTKLEAHRFRDPTSKSLMNKFTEIMQQSEFDDPSMVAISQQKRLNERIAQSRRTQKDPFVMIQRKEKLNDRLDHLSP